MERSWEELLTQARALVTAASSGARLLTIIHANLRCVSNRIRTDVILSFKALPTCSCVEGSRHLLWGRSHSELGARQWHIFRHFQYYHRLCLTDVSYVRHHHLPHVYHKHIPQSPPSRCASPPQRETWLESCSPWTQIIPPWRPPATISPTIIQKNPMPHVPPRPSIPHASTTSL